MRKILLILTKLIKIHNIVDTKYLNCISKLRQSYVMSKQGTFLRIVMTFSTQAPPKLTVPRAQRRRRVAKNRKRGITNADF